MPTNPLAAAPAKLATANVGLPEFCPVDNGKCHGVPRPVERYRFRVRRIDSVGPRVAQLQSQTPQCALRIAERNCLRIGDQMLLRRPSTPSDICRADLPCEWQFQKRDSIAKVVQRFRACRRSTCPITWEAPECKPGARRREALTPLVVGSCEVAGGPVAGRTGHLGALPH